MDAGRCKLTGMIVASVLAILDVDFGLFSGSMVAYFESLLCGNLGNMMVASGFAYMISGGL